MTSKERVFARLAGLSVDKIPNLNIAMALVAKCAQTTYRQYVQDYRKLVEGNLCCVEKFGFDAVSVISDPMREAHAFGATVHFPEHGVPYSEPHLLEDGYDPSRIRITHPLNDKRTLDRIRAVELFHEKVGEDYPIIGWVEGALAEAADLRGVSNIMIDLVEGEPWLEELLDTIYQQQCLFAEEQVKAGADIIGIGNAVASLVGPSLYEEYALQYDQALTKHIHNLGAKVKLHICGNIEPILPLFMQVKPDILDIDWMVHFEKAVQMFEGTPICICGNVDPVAVLLQGSLETVEKEVQACIDASDQTTFLAAGCEVPADTPEANLIRMNELLYV